MINQLNTRVNSINPSRNRCLEKIKDIGLIGSQSSLSLLLRPQIFQVTLNSLATEWPSQMQVKTSASPWLNSSRSQPGSINLKASPTVNSSPPGKKKDRGTNYHQTMKATKMKKT